MEEKKDRRKKKKKTEKKFAELVSFPCYNTHKKKKKEENSLFSPRLLFYLTTVGSVCGFSLR